MYRFEKHYHSKFQSCVGDNGNIVQFFEEKMNEEKQLTIIVQPQPQNNENTEKTDRSNE